MEGRSRTHKIPTISDVAAHAGVSVPTVSRVLSGKVRVSEDKCERVLASVRALGYRPSAAAQNLASLTPRTIGILVLNTRRFGYVETLEGIETAARAEGFTPVIHLLQPVTGESVEDIVRAAVNSRAAGLVLVGFDETASQALPFIPGWMPLVIAGNGGPDHPAQHAVVDEEPAARELVKHLLDLGHQSVYHVALPAARGEEDPRTVGWRRELEAAGCPVPDVLHAEWGAESGYRIGKDIASRPHVTAVFCGNDEVAIGLMRALREAGKRVPEDVSVVGFDDHPLSAYVFPPLTTASLDFQGMGRLACEALLELIRSGAHNNDEAAESTMADDSSPNAPDPATGASLDTEHDTVADSPALLTISAPTRYRESTAPPPGTHGHTVVLDRDRPEPTTPHTACEKDHSQ